MPSTLQPCTIYKVSYCKRKKLVQGLGWGGDMGPDPQDGEGPTYLSEQGRATAHQEA